MRVKRFPPTFNTNCFILFKKFVTYFLTIVHNTYLPRLSETGINQTTQYIVVV